VGELSQRRGEDALASAAQRIAAQFQGSHHCLLPLPSSAWEGQALPSDCPSDLDLSGLQSSSQWGQVVRLNRWLPTAEGGELWLQLADRPLQRRYAIRLAPVFSLQELAS
jgi:hypothetical protein